MKVSLVIDLNNIIHRTLSVCLQIKKGTYIPYFLDFYGEKLITDIVSVIKKVKPAAVTLCRDSKSFRKSLSEKYKSDREVIDMRDYFEVVRKVCDILYDKMGIQNIAKDGLEADDLCRIVAEKSVAEGYDVVLYSSDKDFYQLVNDNISYFYIPTKTLYCADKYFYQLDTLTKIYKNINPVYEIMKKLVFGDVSDCIEGVLGVKSSKKIDNFLFEYSNEFESVKHLNSELQIFTNKLCEFVNVETIENIFNKIKINANLMILLDCNTPSELLETTKNFNIQLLTKKTISKPYYAQ
jgi:DNA polymerase I